MIVSKIIIIYYSDIYISLLNFLKFSVKVEIILLNLLVNLPSKMIIETRVKVNGELRLNSGNSVTSSVSDGYENNLLSNKKSSEQVIQKLSHALLQLRILEPSETATSCGTSEQVHTRVYTPW